MTRKEATWPARVAPIISGLVLIGTLAIVLSFVDELTDLVDDTRANQVTSCEIGNDTREAGIRNLRRDIVTLHADQLENVADIARLKQLRFVVPPEMDVDGWIAAKRRALVSERESIRFKRRTIEETIEAVQDPVGPGSPIRDCSRID